jgi:hypothetical protein
VSRSDDLSACHRDCADWNFAFGFGAPRFRNRRHHELLVLLGVHFGSQTDRPEIRNSAGSCHLGESGERANFEFGICGWVIQLRMVDDVGGVARRIRLPYYSGEVKSFEQYKLRLRRQLEIRLTFRVARTKIVSWGTDEMKKLIVIAIFLAFGAARISFAGTHVEMKDSEQARQAKDIHRRYDHPKTQVVKNDDLKINITTDQIMYSCCMPPNLVVSGKITNVSSRPIDYVRLNFAYEDNRGKILHAESLFNHKAESMADDENTQRILNEKPHFEALQPGQSDTFGFSISVTELPMFSKVELFSNEINPERDASAR